MSPPEHPHGLSQLQISRAIGLARITLIVGLVFLHYGSFPGSLATPFQGLDIHEHRFATWLNSAVLFFFFSSVPLLSMISGWLFFSFPAEEAAPALKKRISRRFKSLYMPLVMWNLMYLAGLYALYLVHPEASFFTHVNRLHMNFSGAGWLDYVNALFGVTKEPLAFQFWFVRDLFVTILVTPVIWQLLRHVPRLGAAVLCLVWLYGFNMGIFTRPDVPFFFYMGALIRHQRLSVAISLAATLGCIALFVGLASLRALAPYVVTFSGGANPLWLDAATRAMRIVGVLGCWGAIYRLAQTEWGHRAAGFGGLAFFLHSAHWPLLAIVKAALAHVIPTGTDGWMLAHYVASVATTVLIGLGLGLTLAYKLPKVFALMNGGRLLSQSVPEPVPQTPPPSESPLVASAATAAA